MRRYRFIKGKAPIVCWRLFILCLCVAGMAAVLGAFFRSDWIFASRSKEAVSIVDVTKTSAPLNTQSPRLCDTMIWSETSIRQQGVLILVNKQNLWPEDLLPDDLVDIWDYKTTSAYALKDRRMRADRTAIIALDHMLYEAAQQGVRDLVVMSAYRGYGKQRILFDQQVSLLLPQAENSTEAEEMANQTVARPGESEHHTGLAFDLMVQGTEMEQFGRTSQGEWIGEHCAQYGFVIRYKPEKSGITGISSEPWHIRYVGVDVAQEMEENGWCLEEYIEHNP